MAIEAQSMPTQVPSDALKPVAEKGAPIISPVAKEALPEAQQPLDARELAELQHQTDLSIREALEIGWRPEDAPSEPLRNGAQHTVNACAAQDQERIYNAGSENNPKYKKEYVDAGYDAEGSHKYVCYDASGQKIEGEAHAIDNIACLEAIADPSNTKVPAEAREKARQEAQKLRAALAAQQKEEIPAPTAPTKETMNPKLFESKFRGALRLRENLTPEEWTEFNKLLEEFKQQDKIGEKWDDFRTKIEKYQEPKATDEPGRLEQTRRQRSDARDLIDYLDPEAAAKLNFANARPEQLIQWIINWGKETPPDKRSEITKKLEAMGQGFNFWKILMSLLMAFEVPGKVITESAEDAMKGMG